MLYFQIIISLLLVTIADAKSYNTSFPGVTWDDSNWRITTTLLDQGRYQARKSLANGYLGINVAALGPFFEVDTLVNGDGINGWPLFDRRQTFATIAGFYAGQPDTKGTNFPWLTQYGGESVIAGVPHWAGLLIQSNGHLLNASVPQSQISNFQSSLDMKVGSLTWQYKWSPPDAPALFIEYSMIVHKLYVNIGAVRLAVTAEQDTNVTLIDSFNGDCAVRSDFVGKGLESNTPSIWSAVRPHWVGNVTAYFFSTLQVDSSVDLLSRAEFTDPAYTGGNKSSIAQSVNAQLRAGQVSVITKYVGGASSDAFDDPRTVARNASRSGASLGYETLLLANKEEWNTVMPADSVDRYTIPLDGTLRAILDTTELQIEAVTNPWNIIQNTIGLNAIAATGNNSKLDANSISVCGLGSSCYAGQIFWDAETWIAPGLVVSNPQAAKQIVNYRVKKFPQAQSNIKEAYTSSRNDTRFTGGAVYPWTSGRFGNCTAVGPCFDYEYHVNGDIGLSLFNHYVASGDTDFFRETLFPVYDSVAYFYGELLTLNNTSGRYDLYNATDPDEYANNVDNPGYTMALMRQHMDASNEFRRRFKMPINETWTRQTPLIDVAVNEVANIVLEYAKMDGSINVKQADVVLIDDFLHHQNPYTLSNLEYYAGKQSLNGPGMTYGVYSIIANEILPSGCASYTYELYGSKPYIRAPWFEYSEQMVDDFNANGGTHPAFPFLTGMGGSHRVAVFGYLGLRLFLDTLNVNPSLPPQISNLHFRTIYWQGHAVDAQANQTHTTLTRLPKSLPNSNSTYATAPIPVTIGYSSTVVFLPPNGTVTLPNRQTGLNRTVPGNIAQCQSVSSASSFVDGQLPLSAVDGAISTIWQAANANETSTLIVETTGPAQPIYSMQFDWARRPPTSFVVTFSNSSEFAAAESVIVAASRNISISKPFDASRLREIVPYASNTTLVLLDPPVWSGRYASLSIFGAHTTEYDGHRDEAGGMVAEWAIVGRADGG